jgi:hypothetical protein
MPRSLPREAAPDLARTRRRYSVLRVPSYAEKIRKAIAEVSDKPITRGNVKLVYLLLTLWLLAITTTAPAEEQSAGTGIQSSSEVMQTHGLTPEILVGRGCCSHHKGVCGLQRWTSRLLRWIV